MLYTIFVQIWAESWRKGRLLLAGDSAHLMPPFYGQGMCSGLRDAKNLGWKLDLVLGGKAEEVFLDTYTMERKPHVKNIIDSSIYLGKIICITDPEEAAARDEAFLTGNAPPFPAFPILTDGILHRLTDGSQSHWLERYLYMPTCYIKGYKAFWMMLLGKDGKLSA